MAKVSKFEIKILLECPIEDFLNQSLCVFSQCIYYSFLQIKSISRTNPPEVGVL